MAAIKQIVSFPKHIAIIMDGNGRWAKKRLSPRSFGHSKGVNPIIETVKYCLQHNEIRAVTLFAFSTENWNRPQSEIAELMKLLMQALNNRIQELHEQQVKLEVIGDISKLTPKIQQSLTNAIDLTCKNNNLTLTIALNYGGKSDIVKAVQKCSKEKINSSKLTENDIDKLISLHHLPPLDLLIRTGGEMRLSNFLLWQAAYAELYFTEELWPDFNQDSMAMAITEFNSRNRRFGKVQ